EDVGLGGYLRLGVEPFEGEDGVVVGVGAEPAHPWIEPAVGLVAGRRVGATGAGQAEPVERPVACDVAVVARMQAGLVPSQRAVVELAGLSVEEGDGGVA